MKVGVYVPGYTPDAGGGYTFELDILESMINMAPESHHAFTFFSPNLPLEVKQRLASNSFVTFYSTQRLRSVLARIVRGVRRLSDRNGRYLSDLSEAAVETGMDCLWFATPTARPINIPYIVTVWDLQHRLQPWFPEVGAKSEWQSRERSYSDLIQRASYVITGAEAGKDEISFFYQIPKERIRILPLPAPAFTIPLDKEQILAILARYQLSPGFLFYPAQFWPHKNHANLLLAFKLLQDKYNVFFDLVLVGSEKGNKGYIQQLARELGIEKKVHFLGFVTREELIALYQSAFALVYVTFFGPENLPPLEAFTLGCPVIASAVHGAEEQLGNAAFQVDPSDPEAIASAVNTLMQDPMKRTELIEHGYERASRWTAKEFVRGFFSILDEFEAIRRSWASMNLF